MVSSAMTTHQSFFYVNHPGLQCFVAYLNGVLMFFSRIICVREDVLRIELMYRSIFFWGSSRLASTVYVGLILSVFSLLAIAFGFF